MNTEAFLICDAATDSQGKLNLLGAFDTVFAAQVPALHRACSVCLRMRFSRIEEGDHKIRISFIDVDGNTVIPPMEGAVSVSFSESQTSRAINLILNINGLKLPHFGEYRVDLAVDGRHESSLPLFLREAPKSPTGTTGKTPFVNGADV
jgi:hypothetical protein